MNEVYKSNLSQTEVIFYGLIYNHEVCTQILPYVKKEYMPEKHQELVFRLVSAYFKKYNRAPSAQELKVAIQNANAPDNVYEPAVELIEDIEEFEQKKTQPLPAEWLVDEAENWCRSRAYHNAVMESISCIENDKDPTHTGIVKKMEEALAVTFDSSVGHDLFEGAEARYDSYRNCEEKVEFILSKFNEITNGGLAKKTLTCFMSNRTGGFKTGTMCHLASDNLRLGKNVLYLTAEMGEFKIGERIDANLLNTDIDDVPEMPKQTYLNSLNRIKEKYTGQIVIKEFATSTGHAGHIRYILKELRRKRGFVPDVVYFDYLNIFASENLPPSARQNSYLWIKSIAEEFRALAQEFNFAGVTATQSNREGVGSTDIDLRDTSESIGLPNILDLFLAVIRTEELDEKNEICYKQIKNRYRDESLCRTFNCGVRRSRMQLYDVNSSFSKQNASPASMNTKTKTTGGNSLSDFKFD